MIPFFNFLKSQQLITALVFMAVVVLAWKNRFLQDDAYISFHYAQNLVEHGRLTYNPTGEFVEGYTNFLWTILMALGMAIGIKPEISSQVLGLCCWAGGLWLIHSWIKKELAQKNLVVLGVALIGTNYSISIYATGGLETPLQFLLTIAAIFQTLKLVAAMQKGKDRAGKYSYLSLIWALGCLNRMDFALVVVWGVIILGINSWKFRPQQLKSLATLSFRLAFPGAIILLLWLSWKYVYYGDIFPNTFYAKVGSIGIKRVLFYTAGFLGYYFLIPLMLTVIVGKGRIINFISNQTITYVLAFILLWLSYLIKIGGDFMEFRMMLPLLPFVYILLIKFWEQVGKPWLIIGSCCYFLMVSFIHGRYYEVYLGIESKDRLADFLMNDKHNLISIGKKLGELFEYDHSISAGIVSAGAIVYHAKFHAIDLLGLNDRYIAKNGRKLTDIPGHQKIAPLSYLYEQKVNVVIGSAVNQDSFATEEDRFQHYLERLEYGVYRMTEPEGYPKSYRIVEIPLDDQYNLYIWYLYPHPKIDQLIDNYQWLDREVEAKMPLKSE